MNARLETIKNNRIVRYCYYYGRALLFRKKLMNKASSKLNEFQIEFLSESERNERINDMVRMNRKYGFTASEYINYRFENKTEKERKEFVADWEHLGYTCAMNDPRNKELFDNKWETYKRFKKYYKREVMLCDSNLPYEKFAKFADTHGRFIIKPLNLSCGKKIRIINMEDYPDKEKLFVQLLKDYNSRFLVEELIDQAPELAKFHPASVNTARIPTIRFDDETVIVHPQFRMGQHGSVVDNAGAGGIKGAIDVESGRIISAVDNLGHVFSDHPDSGERIIGNVIPYWEEAKILVKELAQVVPENRYTGWDLALTKEGWVLVEANRRAQFGFQMSLQKGFRREVNGYLERLGRKY